MAKKTEVKKSGPPPKPSASRALAPTKGNLPSNLAGMMAKDSGKGLSTRQEDNLVPMIALLQKGSPQCEKKDSKYMEGAEAGVIWLKGLDEPFVPGDDGVVAQICHFDGPDWVEWRPRGSGGGYVARHAERPGDATEQPDPNNKDRKKWYRKNGNEVIETRYYTVRIFRDDGTKPAYVMPLSSTGHTFAKDLMFRMNNKALPTGEKAPMFASLWRITTKYRENQSGNWYQYQAEDAGWVSTVEDYEQGLSLYTAFEKGEKKMDTSQMDDASRSTANNDGRM